MCVLVTAFAGRAQLVEELSEKDVTIIFKGDHKQSGRMINYDPGKSITIVTSKGDILLCCDAGPGGEDGPALHHCFSHDGIYIADLHGTIAGIHASVVELRDGSLMALGRGNAIDGRMPCSRSLGMGKEWTYSGQF